MVDDVGAARFSVREDAQLAAEQALFPERTSDDALLADAVLGDVVLGAEPALIDLTGDVPLIVPAPSPDEDSVTAPVSLIPRQTDRRELVEPSVAIGPFRVADLAQNDVVTSLVRGAVAASRLDRAWIAYALHVGGLNDRHNSAYVDAMARADLIYADGMSVIALARLAGADSIERAGTTDIGWALFERLGEALGRTVRVALVGGPDGLTRRAAAVLEVKAGVDVVLTEHGFHEDWQPVLDRLASSEADVVVVGLGAPREMVWVEKHRDALPASLVLTCGGWFGFITDDERRAPRWAQDAGLEWVYRLGQSPRRLIGRYSKGVLSTAELAMQIMRRRGAAAPVEPDPAELRPASGDA